MQGSDFLAPLWDLQMFVTDLTLMHILLFKPTAPGTEGCQHTMQNVILINCLMTWWLSTIKLHWRDWKEFLELLLAFTVQQQNVATSVWGMSLSSFPRRGWGDAPLPPIASSPLDTHVRVSQQQYHSQTASAPRFFSSVQLWQLCMFYPCSTRNGPSAFRSITTNLIFSGMSTHSEEPKRILENINHVSLSQQNP